MSLIVWSGTRNCSCGDRQREKRHQRWPTTSSSFTTPYLPPHENVVRVFQILVVEIVRVKRLCILVEGLELSLGMKQNWLCFSKSVSQWRRHKDCKLSLTQCLRSTSSSASHFRVRNGRFLLMISPAKNVVRVGYSLGSKHNSDVLFFSTQTFLFFYQM